MPRPLSKLQQEILIRVWRQALKNRRDGDPGVAWSWLLPYDRCEPSRAESAALSRSLRRLEQRGLLERLRKPPCGRWSRTRRVRLTAEGWQAAAALRPDLERVIDAWPNLPEPVKAEIAALAARG